MIKYFYPQWWGKLAKPKYKMSFLLWIPLIIFIIFRLFFLWKTFQYNSYSSALAFSKWTLLSYFFLTLGFLCFPFHSIDKFPNQMLRGWRKKYEGIYDLISYRTIPWLSYLLFFLYFLCKIKAKKCLISRDNQKKKIFFDFKRKTKKIRNVGNIFFILWFWLLYCNTCVGWYLPFDLNLLR